MLDNQFGFSNVLARVSFDDENGNIKTVQGQMMIETSTLSYAPGALVKNDFQLQGNGKMDLFDGLIPCDSTITSIIVTGQTAADGIVHFSYTFSGPAYQVKYRIDGIGQYAFATAGAIIDVPGLPNGNHAVEIIPLCQNGYEGTGLEQSFQVTNAQTCTSSIDSITVDTSAFSITNTHAGSATQMRYRIDGGVWIDALITDSISIASISPGNHTIEEIPVCSNGVEGTGLVQNFTIAAQPSMSTVNWSFTTVGNYNIFSIYVNGTLTINQSTAGSGMITVPLGAPIRTVVYGPSRLPDRNVNLSITDSTTATSIYNHTSLAYAFGSATEQYTFNADGDTYQINGTITEL